MLLETLPVMGPSWDHCKCSSHRICQSIMEFTSRRKNSHPPPV